MTSEELRTVTVDFTKEERQAGFPLDVSEAKLDQYVKFFVEFADYNPQDGSGAIARFRIRHGDEWTFRVLDRIVQELRQPSIELAVTLDRETLARWFEELSRRHRHVADHELRPGVG